MIERMTDGKINNCAIANGAAESSCQVCAGACPDQAERVAERATPDGMMRSAFGGFINRTRSWSQEEVGALAAAAYGEVEAMRARNLNIEAQGTREYQEHPGPIHDRLVTFLRDQGIL